MSLMGKSKVVVFEARAREGKPSLMRRKKNGAVILFLYIYHSFRVKKKRKVFSL